MDLLGFGLEAPFQFHSIFGVSGWLSVLIVEFLAGLRLFWLADFWSEVLIA